jgi:hypothetical protein
MTEPTARPRAELADGVSPAVGGTQLARLVAFLQSRGVPARDCADRSVAWIPGVKAELLRIPVTDTGPVDRATSRRLLKAPGIWILSYMREPSEASPANCFNYLCRDRDYHVDNLSSSARRDIRRGLRNFSVRISTWDELLEHGMPAYVDTDLRHGHATPSPDSLKNLADIERDCPFIDVWGAWIEGRLSAWIKVLHVDDWAFITTACSVRQDLRLCPNNALAYEATRHYLSAGCSSVSYGISSLQETSNILPLHRFKVRMGYQAVPQVRTFLPHPLLSAWLRSPLCSRALDYLASRFPGKVVLSKMAGLASLLSGRQQDPLKWAKEGADEPE